MNQSGTLSLILIALSSLLLWNTNCTAPSESQAALPEQVDFNLHIKPILSDRCFKCHGPDKNQREAGLALHEKDLALAELPQSPGHYAIVPGKPEKSELIKRVIHRDPLMIMPPPESNLTLTGREIRLLEKWIAQGAEWKDHWAFIAPKKPEVPEVKQQDWPLSPIDHFVLEKMQSRGLSPSPPAHKAEWLRRVSFDLTGLPPTPQAIDDFLQDESPDSYERQVDALLRSSAYGERMTIDWLDVARYADSHGYQDDRPRTMWPWRDWVIRAYNANMPYDRFVTWQLAGDLLPNANYEQKLATGFNRNHAITQEGGVVNEEYLTEYAADRSQTFSTAFLGLTMECARCHDHKYDPISQADYYSLFSFFNNVPQERGQISYFDKAPVPNLQMQDPMLEKDIEEIKNLITDLEDQKEQRLRNASKLAAAWIKNIEPATELKKSLTQGLLADCTLDEPDEQPYINRAAPHIHLEMNINLPPEIELPVKTQGHSGQALSFNGANFLSLGDIGDFEHNDPFSFGGWIRHSDIHEKNAGIFSRRNGEQHRQGYDLSLSPTNRLRMRLTGERNNLILVEDRSPIPAGEWNHVMITYDGSGRAAGIRLFVNGQARKTKTIQDNLDRKTMLNGNNFLVGNWNHRAVNLPDLYGFAGGAVDQVQVYDRQLSAIEIAFLSGEQQFPKPPTRKELAQYYLHTKDREFKAINRNLRKYRGQDLSVPYVMVMQEADTIASTFILARGAYDAPTTKVKRSTPAALLPFPEDFPNDRLGLAQWLFHPEHPLTARVYVNRLWQMCFGKGLVSTTEDFGSQGKLPTHPELLDWLAEEFEERNWDIQAMLKEMVLSATYRQAAAINPYQYEIDPQNEWYSRGPSTRLTAEMLRDQALAASDLLHPQVGGKWVKPYQPAGIWKELANQIGENKYRQSQGHDLYRRSLYTYWKRTIPPPTMVTLDAPERSVCTVKRQVTSTPLQALILLNDPQYIEAARVLAENLAREKRDKPEAWITTAAKVILSREIAPDELAPLLELYDKEYSAFQRKPEDAATYIAIGDTPNLPDEDRSGIAALSVVINTIMNLDEAKFK